MKSACERENLKRAQNRGVTRLHWGNWPEQTGERTAELVCSTRGCVYTFDDRGTIKSFGGDRGPPVGWPLHQQMPSFKRSYLFCCSELWGALHLLNKKQNSLL